MVYETSFWVVELPIKTGRTTRQRHTCCRLNSGYLRDTERVKDMRGQPFWII